MTFLSRLLGFVRDTLIARIFGADMVSDAFVVAFKIPNLFRRISAEGAFSQAFVPILSEYKSQRDFYATRELINRTATLLGILLIVVTLLGILLAPLLVAITAPGFSHNPEKMQLTVALLRITFPYLLFISLVAMAGGVLNTFNRFVVPAFTPVWLNVSMIVAMLFIAPYTNHPIYTLAWSVLAGGILQLAFQIPFLKQIGLLPRWDLCWHDSGVRRILHLMFPALLGVSVAQISLILNTLFASLLVSGSISWLYYADRLMEFPVGVLGAALGTILLPRLSAAYAKRDANEYNQTLDWGLQLCCLLALPATVSLCLLATPLVVTLFHYGKFNAHDVIMTQSTVVAYSIGLLGLILIKILAPAFYARQDIRTPVRIAIITLLVTQLLNVIFIFGLHLRHVGLALAISLGACLNASLLFYTLRKRDWYRPLGEWRGLLLKLGIALTALGCLLYAVNFAPQAWLKFSALSRWAYLISLIGLGGGVYFAMLFVLGVRWKQN